MGYEGIRGQLERYRKKYHGLEIARGSILFVGAIALSTTLFALIEYYAYLGSTIKTILFLTWLLSSVVLLWFYIVRPALAYFLGFRSISDRAIAVRIGAENPSVEDKLINYLELERNSGIPEDFLKEILKQKTIELERENLFESLDLKIVKRVFVYTSIPLSMVILFALFNGNIFKEGTNRFFDYQTAYSPKAPFEFISDEGWTVQQGEGIEIDLSFSGDRIPNEAFILFDGERLPMQRTPSGKYTWKISRVVEDLQLQFEASGFLSDVYNVEVLEVPLLSTFSLAIIPPAYTGISPFQTDGTGDGVIPQGSEVKWIMKWSHVDEVTISGDRSADTASLTTDGWLVARRVMEGMVYRINGSNRNGTNFRSGSYQIDVLPDRNPEITGTWRLDSATGLVYASGQVEDDYGVTSVRLKINGKEDSRYELVDRNADRWTVIFEPREGDNSFEVIVTDNDAVNGRKSTSIGPFRISLPDAREREKALNERDRRRVQDVEKFRELQEQSKELRNSLEERLIEGTNEWRQAQMRRQLQEQQQQLLEQWEQMKESFQQLNEERILNDPENGENAEKRRELEELLEEMDTERLEELLEEMKEEGENMNEDNLRDWMKRIQFENERMEMDAERIEELMKRLNFEQNLDRALRDLEALQKEQQELSERSDDTQSEQDSLNERFEELMNDMDSLEKQNEELKDPMSFEAPNEKGEQTQESMKESSKELKNGQPENANEQQQKSSQSMQEMMEQMSSSIMSMQMEMHIENLANLRRILTNLIHLSDDQEGLLDNDMSGEPSDPVVVNWMKNQQDIRKGYEVVDDSLAALIQRVPQVEAVVTRWMVMAKDNMERSNASLSERQMPRANSSMRESMLALNELALMMDVTMDQIQQQMSGMMQGEQTCQNPGGSTPSMSNMRKLQQQLSEQMQQMGGSQGNGESEEGEDGQEGQSGEGEGGKGSQGRMSQEIVEMMSRQNQIREMLKGSTGNNGNGDLEKMLEENERDLANRNFDTEFWDRQKEIEVKMLELEEAERQQEQDDQRESQTGDRYQELKERYREEFLRENQNRREQLRYETPLLTPYYRERSSSYLRR